MTVPGPPPPPQRPGPPWPPQPPRRRAAGGIRIPALLVPVAVFVLVVAGAAVGITTLFASGSAVAAEVSTEPVSTAGANPFMPSIGTDQANVAAPAGLGTSPAGNPFPGDKPGLYGGTLNNASCDPPAMVAFLAAHPDKGAAWAGVLGITPAEIPAYVAGLTPVILRADTFVTNHGFVDARATTLTSVLQAGTAVLVDRFGIPRVRCSCGNPLTPAVIPSSPRYVGPAWSGFSTTSIVIVQQTTTVIDTFTLVDPTTDRPFQRPRGSAGAGDTPGTPTTPTSTPATPTVATPTAIVTPPTRPTTAAAPPAATTSTGRHTLIQQDGADCSFSDAPSITGSFAMTAAPDGSVDGRLAAEGSGTRDLTCGDAGGRMNWHQSYTATFTGRISNGRFTATGTLVNTNTTTITGCTNAGHPVDCEPYQNGQASFTITLTGTYDRSTGDGSGTFAVSPIDRTTTGTWTVRG